MTLRPEKKNKVSKQTFRYRKIINMTGGWTSHTTQRKATINGKEISVPAKYKADAAARILKLYTGRILNGTGVRIKFDKKSFIDYAQDPTYDDKTIISWTYNKEYKRLKKILGEKKWKELGDAEAKAMQQVFGYDAWNDAGPSEEDTYDDTSFTVSFIMHNPWGEKYDT